MPPDTRRYDTTALRELLTAAFSDAELDALCYDRFRPVFEAFSGGMSKAQKVQRLVEHCERQMSVEPLLAVVRERNPAQYAHFEARLIQPAQPPPPPAPADVDAYLETVRAQCGRMETRPYRQLSELRGAPPRLPLLEEEDQAGVYVPLRFDLHPSRTALGEHRPPTADRDQLKALERDLSRTNVDLTEVLATPGHVVLIGAAGCGKTTVLRLVAAVLASQDPALARARLGLETGPLPLPIFVALRDFEHACQTEPRIYRRDLEGLLRFLDAHFARWHPDHVPAGFLSGLVRAGRAWLLLDALDEVAQFDHRIAVRQVIEQLAGAFPGNRLLVTARVAAYASANTRLDERFHLATVRDLTREQWKPIVERLYAGLEPGRDLAAERARRLVGRIDAAPLLQEMVKTPLMVWTATLIHYADRELPEQRAELYGAYADVLLGERLHEEESAEPAQRLRAERWPLEDRRLYLTYAAYQVHAGAESERAERRGRDALVIVDEHDLVRRVLAPFMASYLGLQTRQARREAADFVALMAERSGLLHAHEGGYSFGDHLTVQEFLAANYLVDNLRGTGDWPGFLRERAGQSWWREVFMLMGGYLLQWPQQARRFLLEELGALPEGDDARAYGLAWAGRALLEIPPRRVGWHEAARAELARRLLGVLWENPPTTSVAARVEAGDVLGRLGDPRFAGEFLLPEFIPIPGGSFWMGSAEAEVERLVRESGKELFRDEAPRHQVELAAYALARYPTTNAMFTRFMEAGGYTQARWWEEARKAGVWQSDGTVKDWFGNVRRQPAYWEDGRFNGPNQPVVGVTWYEALAYCRWLTAGLDDGQRYHLPSEAQWERAARGPGSPPSIPPRGGEAESRSKASKSVPAPSTAPGATSPPLGGTGGGETYPWGEGWQPDRANTEELGLERTTPVGIYPDGASPEGLLDMAGQVWEWCSDWYAEDAYRRRADRVTRDPLGPDKGEFKILRGGSWYNDRNFVRCASRGRGIPVGRDDISGFRVARGPLK
jgi:formylglycine-generating enzyme required for sulfatase activity/energy-coupling factor transporter ATP-binding protein EcfA2